MSDNGIGIAAEQMPRIFEMFAPGRSLRSSARRAAWASACRSSRGLVEMHGGRIGAHSAGLGQGSEFVVRLPLAAGRPRRRRRPRRRARSRPAARRLPRAGRRRPARQRRQPGAAARARWGMRSRSPTTARRRCALAERFRPDVVLLDLGMPKLDGFEVCRRIRAAALGRADAADRPDRLGPGRGPAPHAPRPASTTTSSSRSIRRRSTRSSALRGERVGAAERLSAPRCAPAWRLDAAVGVAREARRLARRAPARRPATASRRTGCAGSRRRPAAISACGVHHERAVLRDRLADRPALQQQELGRRRRR